MFSGFLGPFFCSFALSGRVIFCTAFSSARPPFFFVFKSRHQNRERGQGTLFESFSAGDNGSVITIFASGKSVLYLLLRLSALRFFLRSKNFPDYGDVTSRPFLLSAKCDVTGFSAQFPAKIVPRRIGKTQKGCNTALHQATLGCRTNDF